MTRVLPAALLAATLTACAPPITARCLERLPDGRQTWRSDAPMASGLCPTPADMIAAQAVQAMWPRPVGERLRGDLRSMRWGEAATGDNVQR